MTRPTPISAEISGNRPILLLGGSGFIGRAVDAALRAAGRAVLVAGRQADPANGQLSYDEVASLPTNSIAAAIDFTHCWGGSAEDYCHLLRGNVALMAEIGVDRFVYCSSGGAIYGHANRLPLVESDEPRPIGAYGKGKCAAEAELLRLADGYGFVPIIVRPANVYGPGHRPGSGQGLVTAAFACISDGRPISVFGDGGHVRDYVYIQDAANAILAALELGEAGEAYNIGTGIGTSIVELLDRIGAIAGPVKIDWQPARATDVNANVLAFAKLNELSGWHPAVSLNEGLELSWKAFRGSH